jgi:hypothetical protein
MRSPTGPIPDDVPASLIEAYRDLWQECCRWLPSWFGRLFR